jgi:hypothetical protein
LGLDGKSMGGDVLGVRDVLGLDGKSFFEVDGKSLAEPRGWVVGDLVALASDGKSGFIFRA